MARPFAYNPSGATISGCIQVGDIAVGVASQDYFPKPGNVLWWNGPDEGPGYIIAKAIPSGNQPNSINRITSNGQTASIGFYRSESKTDESFLNLVKVAYGQVFGTASDARTWLNDNGYWTSYTVYSIANGTKSPDLGNGAQNPFPASGWTSIVSSSEDDSYREVALPFTWTFNSTGYTSFFPTSNFYITFGTGTGQYSGLGPSSPNYDKIFFGGKDNSWQRVSTFEEGDKYLRLRFEGQSSTGGTPGSPGIVYELTFFNPIYTNGENWLELLVGDNNMPGQGISGIYSQTSQLTGGQIVAGNVGVAALQSYVLQGNSTGTSWTVHTGKYVGGTEY